MVRSPSGSRRRASGCRGGTCHPASGAKADPRVNALTVLPGVGELSALVILAEIGDVTRFGDARKLASWAGLTPTVRGSDVHVRYGHIWKAGVDVAALDPGGGGADREEATGVRRQLPGDGPPAREEDRDYRGRPQAAHPRLPSAAGRRRHQRPDASLDTQEEDASRRPCRARRRPARLMTGRGHQPRVSSRFRMSRPQRRAR